VLDGNSTNDRVRVLHVITDAGPHPQFDLIGANADRERFDLRLATVGVKGALHAAAERMRLPSYALGAMRRSQYPRAVIALARLLRRQRIDVVQTHLLDGSVIGLLAARLARVPVAVFMGHHSHEIPLHNRRSLTAVDRLCARTLSDAVIAPSAQMRDTFVRFHGVEPEKVKVVHHGFELDGLDAGSIDGSAVRAELGLDGRTVITSIGRVYWIKNQEALVRAFAHVAADASDPVLLLVGAGDYGPVRELARSLGVEDRVRTLPARGDVPAVLGASDLFVHPALAESFALVIVEAMAMGCPVVSTPVGIAPDVVKDGRTGLLAADGGVEGLAEALRRALSMRDSWPEWGAAARASALHFPADRMVRAYEALYLDLLTASR
jgi:glycosyltransferase involved in cell wall biosynthesis